MVTTPPSLNPRAVRLSLGISRDRMGRLLEVTSKTVARLEDQERLPAQSAAATRLARLKELADLEGVTSKYMQKLVAKGLHRAQEIFDGLRPRKNQ